MIDVTINNSQNFEREQKSGEGWIEMGGDKNKTTTFLSRAKAIPHTQFQYLTKLDNGESVTASLNYLRMRERTVGVSITNNSDVIRVFRTSSPEVAEALVREILLYGTLKQDVESSISYYNGQALDKRMYETEAKLFQEETYLPALMKQAGLSIAAAKDKVEKETPSKVMTKSETIRLIQEIADEYGIKNLRVSLRKLFGRMGCARLQQFPLFSLPQSSLIEINETTNLKHVVLHEMAHIIEIWNTGSSSHGAEFGKIYADLLVKYHDGVGADSIRLAHI